MTEKVKQKLSDWEKEIDIGAKLYDEALEKDPRLKLEMEAEDRHFLDKRDRKRKEEREAAAKKKVRHYR
jgi:hypothetical protein